jgi:chromosome segregation ATPase
VESERTVTDPRITMILEELRWHKAISALDSLERELDELRAEREKELAHRRDQDERWQAASKKWSQEITELRAENKRLRKATEALRGMLDAHACDLNTWDGEICGHCSDARSVLAELEAAEAAT